MKTRSIARGIVGSVATLLGVMAVGCSAETGSGPEAEIGSAAQPLSTTSRTMDSIKDINNSNAAVPLAFAASCKLTLSGKDYKLMAGGWSSTTPTVSNKWVLLDASGTSGGSNQWVASGTFSTARARAKMIPISATECLMAGGEDASQLPVTSDKTLKFTISAGPTITVAGAEAGGALSKRSDFQLLPCGSGAIAIGGRFDASTPLDGASPNSRPTIQIWTSAAGGTWTNATHSGGTATELSVNRFDFAAVKDPTANTNRYLLSAGQLSGGSQTKSIEIIDAGSSCTATSTDTDRGVIGTLLTDAVQGNVLMPEGRSGKFLSLVGLHKAVTPTLPTTPDLVTVDWTTGGGANTTSVAASAFSVTGTYQPTVASFTDGSGDVHYALLGGANKLPANFSTASAIQAAQEFKFTPGSSGSFATVVTTGFTARIGSAAEYLPSQHTASPSEDYLYVSGGYVPGASPSVLTTVEEFKTP